MLFCKFFFFFFFFYIVVEVLKTVSESRTLHMLFHWASPLDNLTSNLFVYLHNFNPSYVPSLLVFNFTTSFFVSCYCPWICIVYAYTFLNTTYLVHMILLVCLFSGLVVWNWATNWYVVIWRKPLLLLPALCSFLQCFLCRFMPSLA